MPTIYDHPLYYDILFGWDRDAEAASYDAILRVHSPARSARVLDVGCGSGQLSIRLAALGWKVIGLDHSQAMLDYQAQASDATGVELASLPADMCDFTIPRPLAGAVCALGSLGLLANDTEVAAHLQSMAAALEPRAPYVLDLGLGQPEGPGSGVEDTWEMARDGISVSATPEAILVADPELDAPLELTWGGPLRSFTASDFEGLVVDSGVFTVVGHHPETHRGSDDVSRFDSELRPGLATGRALVVRELCQGWDVQGVPTTPQLPADPSP